MFSKPVSQLARADLDLVLGVEETDRLEFKRDAYGRKDEDIREMLRDLTSMANASGGFLLIGVEANTEERATAFPGIENGPDELARMVSSFLANIEEQILGLEFTGIEITPGRHVIVFGIPRSTRAPHLITFGRTFQFWRRHGTQKARMTIEEIREACLRVENVRRNLEDFIRERREQQLAMVRGQEARMLLSATPLIVRDEVLDISDAGVRELLRNPPANRQHGYRMPSSDNIRPTLYGLATGVGDSHLRVFRNGHVECEVEIALPERTKILSPWGLAEFPLNFLIFVRALTERIGLHEPIVISVTLAGVAEWSLRTTPWRERRDIEIPPMQFTYPLEPGMAAKRIADRIWNAFGMDECPLFDERGQFNGDAIDRFYS